jgi:hypothetical protein
MRLKPKFFKLTCVLYKEYVQALMFAIFFICAFVSPELQAEEIGESRKWQEYVQSVRTRHHLGLRVSKFKTYENFAGFRDLPGQKMEGEAYGMQAKYKFNMPFLWSKWGWLLGSSIGFSSDKSSVFMMQEIELPGFLLGLFYQASAEHTFEISLDLTFVRSDIEWLGKAGDRYEYTTSMPKTEVVFEYQYFQSISHAIKIGLISNFLQYKSYRSSEDTLADFEYKKDKFGLLLGWEYYWF